MLVDSHDDLMLYMNQLVDENVQQSPFIAVNSPRSGNALFSLLVCVCMWAMLQILKQVNLYKLCYLTKTAKTFSTFLSHTRCKVLHCTGAAIEYHMSHVTISLISVRICSSVCMRRSRISLISSSGEL